MFELSRVAIHFKNYYYDIQDPKNPVKRYYDKNIEAHTSDIGLVQANIFISKNEYKTTDWMPFFTDSRVKTFYSIDKYETSIRSLKEESSA